MPVFHTKTIESILDPVAQQVSRLVILHEEAEDGNAMPDLTKPVDNVSKAVDNLVQIGYDTCRSSDDQILRQDMPPALQRVEASSKLLEDACKLLKEDAYSVYGRKKLIEGARGILQGTSALLLCFDESEVRKIIRGCKKVLDYLAVTEVIENMDDLVQFVKDISPWLTRMSVEIDTREKELTHQVHREILNRSMGSIKTLAPVLICGMKIFIQIHSQRGKGVEEAAENRNYLSQRITDEVNEIIRIIQLTTYDEDEWDADNLTVMKKAIGAIESLLQAALDWLADSRALRGGVGEKSLRRILDYAERIADRALPDDAQVIRRFCSDISAMTSSLCELRHSKQGDSSQAQSLAKNTSQKLRELIGSKDIIGLLQRAIQNLERSGFLQPAHTVLGRIEQALKWLENPNFDDKGLGLNAIRLVTEEGRKVSELCRGSEKHRIMQLCDEIDRLANHLTDLQRRGLASVHNPHQQPPSTSSVQQRQVTISEPLEDTSAHHYPSSSSVRQLPPSGSTGNKYISHILSNGYCPFEHTRFYQGDSPQALEFSAQLQNKMNELKDIMSNALTDKIVEDFADITTPLKQFTDAVHAPENAPGRDEYFKEKAHNLQDHSLRCAHTGRLVGTAGPCKNKRIVESLCYTANQVSSMTPQVVNAGKIRMHYPTSKSADEHFENLRQEYANALQRLRTLVDDAIDTASFIKATEDAMQRYTALCEDAINHNQPPRMVENTSNVARLANRVLMTAKNEADNSEDQMFVNKINNASDRLQENIPVMVQDAKQVALNMRDQSAIGTWRRSNNNLLGAVSSVRKAIFVPEDNLLPVRSAFDTNVSASRPWAPPPPRRRMWYGPDEGMGYFSDTDVPVTWSRPKEIVRNIDLPNIDFQDIFDMRQYQSDLDYNALFDLTRSPYLLRRNMPNHSQTISLPPPVMYVRREEAPPPPRPPPPQEHRPPPRPPPPQETDDEEEIRAFWDRVPLPKANQPILSAAHSLHQEVRQWSSRENEIVAAAKRMAILMAKLSQLVRGEGGTKKDLIDCSKAIADSSDEVTRLAIQLARQCTDIKMKKALLQVCERIPTIATQLKILSTVKATMLGSQGSSEDEEAMQQLVINAQNLMQSVKDTVRAAEAASIKIRTDSGLRLRWIRRPAWNNYS